MRGAVVLVLAGGLAVRAAGAPEDAAPLIPPAPPPTIEDLLRRVEGLEGDKARMQDQIDELRAQAGEDWLTQERAAQVRAIVADVLADAETRASLMQDGLTAGWSEHFFLASPDGRFKLQLEGQLQTRWIWNYHNEVDRYQYGFDNPLTRLTFSGHVFNPGLTYRIQSNFSNLGGGGDLQDAWIRWQLDDNWAVRAGQFRVPFTREELVDESRQQAVDRSLVNESLNLGRSQGIELFYEGGPWRWALAVIDAGEDNIGGGGFVGARPANTPWFTPALGEYSFATRIEHLAAGRWEQFDQFTSPPGDEFAMMVGAAGYVFQGSYGDLRLEEFWLAGTVDLSLQFGGANLFGSVTYDYLDDPQSGFVNVLGAVVQGGAYFSPKFEAFARVEYGFFDFQVVEVADLWVLTMGGNYYFDGQDVKLTADFGFGISQITQAWNAELAGWRAENFGADPQVVVRVQLQLLF